MTDNVEDMKRRAYERGQQQIREDFLAAGEMLDGMKVIELTGIDYNEFFFKRNSRQLFELYNEMSLFPAFQFDNGRIMPEIKEILDWLPTTNQYAILNFFVQPNYLLNEKRPMDVLKTHPSLVVEAAKRYGEMGS